MLMWGKFWVTHYDTTFAVTNPNVHSMGGLDIARVKLIFSFRYHAKTYLCALVHWFSKINVKPYVNTRMWQVEPDFNGEGDSVIHLDAMICAAHLICEPDGPAITYISALDMFDSFYVNKYVDHHAYKITF